MSGPGRVLLLEDDPQIRRFVSLVLAPLGVELVECASVAQALAALQQAPADVAICDLMLSGESGFDLIERIAATEAWRATRVVVFSAGIDSDDRTRMKTLGVWGQLDKPTSVADLTRCVERVLAARAPGAAPVPAGVPAPDAGGAPRLPTHADEAAAVARFFEGDAALFRTYRDSCAAQFRVDLAQGDAALARADLQQLRRLAHSLKTVVDSLGAGALALGFGELEAAARDHRHDEARAQWARLRGFLGMLADRGAGVDG